MIVIPSIRDTYGLFWLPPNTLVGFDLTTRGRCYDHNFLRFLPIFGEKKLAFFSKTNVMITIFAKTSSSLSKNANIFARFFVENIFKNHSIGPSKLQSL
jgi:hypothetical protein